MEEYLVLLICRDRDLGDLLKNRLEEGLSGGDHRVYVNVARNQSEARALINTGQYALLVTEAEIHADRMTPLDEQAHLGLVLLETANPRNIPAVLLSSSFEDRLRTRAEGIHAFYALIPGKEEEWQALINQCDAALGHPVQEHGMGCAKIAMSLADNAWTYSLNGSLDHRFERLGHLQVDKDVMAMLYKRTNAIERLADDESWQDNLTEIGIELRKQIIVNNPDFFSDVTTFIGVMGGTRNIKVEFLVEKKIHGIMLEALLTPGDNNFWMLQGPIYRKLGRPMYHGDDNAPRAPNSKEPLNCLLIEADTQGEPIRDGVPFPPSFSLKHLTNVHPEIMGLDALFRKPGVHVELISEPDPDESFSEKLRRLSQNKRWDIVHFAGHSYCEENKDTAYLFLPGMDRPDVVTAGRFSSNLNHPRFVYLSSCESSQAPFLFDLAFNEVGAALGFRWKINDGMATKFALAFYKHLFEGSLSIEQAFLNTRRDMYNAYPANRIWAAPILMLMS